MGTNFGIGFYFFDRVFPTMAKSHRPFNWEGYEAVIGRYGMEEMEPLRLRGCGKARFHEGAGIKIGRATRLNSSHGYISYAVFCLKKKQRHHTDIASSAEC